MLFSNLDPYRNHFDATKYLVIAFHSNILILKSLTNDNAGKISALTKMSGGFGDRNFESRGLRELSFLWESALQLP